MSERTLLSIKQAADRLSVKPDTIRDWINSKSPKHARFVAIWFNLTPGSGRINWRTTEYDLDRYITHCVKEQRSIR